MKNRIQARDFENPAHWLTDVHEFETHSFFVCPLTQLQQHSQAMSIDGSHARQIEYDCALLCYRLHRPAKRLRLTCDDLPLQRQDCERLQIFAVYLQHGKSPNVRLVLDHLRFLIAVITISSI